MGQITLSPVKGITVNTIDRQSGPGAGAGAVGNNAIFLGNNAGLNSSVSQLIVIGSESGKGGISDVGSLTGTTIVGAGSAAAVTSGNGEGFPLTLFGSNNLTVFNGTIGNAVVVGSKIMPAATGFRVSNCVLMGDSIGLLATSTTSAFANNVIIGNGLAPAANPFTMQNSVYIGNNIGPIGGGGFNSSADLIIGNGAVTNYNNGQANIALGSSNNLNPFATQNVMIGNAATIGNATSGAPTGNVVIGNTANCAAGTRNVLVGQGINSPSTLSTNSNVIIGSGAGVGIASTDTNILLIEATTAATGGAVGALMYGNFTTGNLVVGNSVQGTNRDLQGTNTLKILNGTVGGSNPIGGGYFYASAGALHWKGSAGTDTVVAPA